MRILHRTMMTAMLAAVLAVGVGEAQHGHSADAPDHFTAIAERLELTAAQRETLEEPFREMMAAIQELHRTHDVIALELTDEQKTTFAQMFDEAMKGSAARNRKGHHGEARH